MDKKLIFGLILICGGLIVLLALPNPPKTVEIENYAVIPDENWHAIQASFPEENITKLIPTYVSDAPEEEKLEDIQCPIPKSDRVPNYTGIQCVWSSIEALGRWAEEPKLMNPPLTSRSECKSYSGPSLAAEVLTKYNVKFKQTYKDRAKGIAFIKEAMAEGRGCLWDVPGHAMILIHYDESKNEVKYVDNSDSRLAVQTITIERFNQRWGSWILIIYADNDIIPNKLNRVNQLAQSLPILENNQILQNPKNYIQMPSKNTRTIPGLTR